VYTAPLPLANAPVETVRACSARWPVSGMFKSIWLRAKRFDCAANLLFAAPELLDPGATALNQNH